MVLLPAPACDGRHHHSDNKKQLATFPVRLLFQDEEDPAVSMPPSSPHPLILTSPFGLVQDTIPVVQPEGTFDVVGLQQLAEGSLLTLRGFKKQLGKALVTVSVCMPPVQSSGHIFVHVS